MISHKYKCIFVHIQRTAGTSIENWIVGKDWWRIDKESKHLLASQAKKEYKKYWNNYFKFSFVRNPWDRMVSLLIFPDFYGVTYNGGILNFDGYKSKYGYPAIVENDSRFSDRKNILSNKHKKNSVYLNILDEELDFIGKFEDLKEDTNFIREKLHIKDAFKLNNITASSPSKLQLVVDRFVYLQNAVGFLRSLFGGRDFESISKQKSKAYRKYYNKETRVMVEEMYKKDIEKFKYKY